MMTMALAVAMVACTGATSVRGETGAQGPTGEAGPAGPPGTLDNEPPMATKELSKVYLALKGTGKMPDKTGINLNDHFSDAEKAALTYEAESSAPAVATVKVTGTMLDVMGKGAGMATVTVKAYDGVSNEPATSSFEVMVVASNIAPSVTVVTGTTGGAANLETYSDLSTNLYAERKVTVSMSVDPGVAGTAADAVTFEAIMGPKKGVDDDVVTVNVAEKEGAPGEYVITLTPKTAGRQTVYLLMKDKFGKEVWDSNLKFIAMVNTVPVRDATLPEAKLFMTGGSGRDRKEYLLADFFVLKEKEETGITALDANGDPAAVQGTARVSITDGKTASELYLSERNTEKPAALTGEAVVNDGTCTASTDDPAIADVGIADDGTGAKTIAVGTLADTSEFNVIGKKAGTAELTITCSDVQGGDVGTATIKVRA